MYANDSTANGYWRDVEYLEFSDEARAHLHRRILWQCAESDSLFTAVEKRRRKPLSLLKEVR
jgi:hypothetical protein